MKVKVDLVRMEAVEGVYVKNTAPYILQTDLIKKHKSQNSEYENCWIEIVNSKKAIWLIGVFYIDRCNLNLLRVDKSKDANNFFDLITSKWFIQHILGPTRFSDQQKSSLVDNIFTNIKLKRW